MKSLNNIIKHLEIGVDNIYGFHFLVREKSSNGVFLDHAFQLSKVIDDDVELISESSFSFNSFGGGVG